MLICYGTVGSRTWRGTLWKREKKMNLGCFDCWQKFISFFLIFGDISIFMQPKCFRFCDGWKLLDELNVICILAIRGCIIYSWCRELVIIVQDTRGVENWHNVQQRFAVMTICHSQYTQKKTDSKNMCRLKLTDSVVANNYFMLLCFVTWLLLLDDVFAVCLRQNKLLSGSECSWVKKNTMVVAHIKHHYMGP